MKLLTRIKLFLQSLKTKEEEGGSHNEALSGSLIDNINRHYTEDVVDTVFGNRVNSTGIFPMIMMPKDEMVELPQYDTRFPANGEWGIRVELSDPDLKRLIGEGHEHQRS